MPKYDVTVSFEFRDLEADSEEDAQVVADEAVGVVEVQHPQTKEKIYSDVEAWERP